MLDALAMTDNAPLMLSISGVRGIVGRSMTADAARRFATAFAANIRNDSVDPSLIVLGRDSRSSGAELASAGAAGLIESGCDVVDLGIVMTPTVGIMVHELAAAGGMVITASHNPAQWNGIKCLNHYGAAPPRRDAEAIIARFQSTEAVPAGDIAPGGTGLLARAASINRVSTGHTVHMARVLSALGEEAIARIREARFRVVLDSINGAGCVAGRMLLEALGCTIIQLNGNPDGNFAHTPEPIEENLGDLCAVVKRERADIGFAQDPDGDRLAIVDEHGTYIGEEYTLALCGLRALEREIRPLAPGSARGPKRDVKNRGEVTLAANLSTSRMIDDVAAMFPQLRPRIIRTAVGEANVVEALMAARAPGAHALIGGEGNGGVILPEVCWVRDSLISMALVLDLLANSLPSPPGRRVAVETRGVGGERATPLSQIVARLPRYTMIKRKFDLGALGGENAVEPMLAKVKTEFSNRAKHPDARINDADGIRIDFADGWVHLRPSNTEPIVRLIAESVSKGECESLIEEVAGCAIPLPAK